MRSDLFDKQEDALKNILPFFHPLCKKTGKHLNEVSYLNMIN